MVQRNTTGFNRGDKLTQHPTVLVLFQVVFELHFLMAPSLSGLAKGIILDPCKWLFFQSSLIMNFTVCYLLFSPVNEFGKMRFQKQVLGKQICEVGKIVPVSGASLTAPEVHVSGH